MGKNKAAAWRLLVTPTDTVVPSGLLCSVMDPSTFADRDFKAPAAATGSLQRSQQRKVCWHRPQRLVPQGTLYCNPHFSRQLTVIAGMDPLEREWLLCPCHKKEPL